MSMGNYGNSTTSNSGRQQKLKENPNPILNEFQNRLKNTNEQQYYQPDAAVVNQPLPQQIVQNDNMQAANYEFYQHIEDETNIAEKKSLKKRGRPKRYAEKSQHVAIYLPPVLIDLLQVHAQENGKTVSEYIVSILNEKFEDEFKQALKK